MKSRQHDIWLCANCGLEIDWEPVVAEGRTYCCGGCARGGPCYCSYDAAEPAGSQPLASATDAGVLVGPAGRTATPRGKPVEKRTRPPHTGE